MATYCPPVAPYTPDTQVKVKAQSAPIEPAQDPQSAEVEDIWEAPSSNQVRLKLLSRNISRKFKGRSHTLGSNCESPNRKPHLTKV